MELITSQGVLKQMEILELITRDPEIGVGQMTSCAVSAVELITLMRWYREEMLICQEILELIN